MLLLLPRCRALKRDKDHHLLGGKDRGDRRKKADQARYKMPRRALLRQACDRSVRR